MTDDELIARLGAAFPPVPGHLIASGRAAFDCYVPGATLATAARDGDLASAGVRGGGPRLITFTAPGVRVEIEVSGDQIVGQLTPPADAEVTLRSPADAEASDRSPAEAETGDRSPAGAEDASRFPADASRFPADASRFPADASRFPADAGSGDRHPGDAEVTPRSPADAGAGARPLEGHRRTRTDSVGGFVLTRIPAGPVSLLFRLPDATSVVTSWIHV